MKRASAIAALGASCALVLMAGCAVSTTEQGTPRVAVVVDESNSFKDNLSSAVKIVARFVRENALAGDCEVYLIAMDRAPRVLDFYPSGRTLDASGNQILETLETGINPLDGTDVVGALQLAADKLSKSNGQVVSRTYLLVFSDCQVDPGKDAPAMSFPPLAEFDWGSLDQTCCRFYFVAPQVEGQLMTLTQTANLDVVVLDAMESRRLLVSDIIAE